MVKDLAFLYIVCSLFSVAYSQCRATCYDGILNQGETQIDCGGPCAACVTPPAAMVPNPTVSKCEVQATTLSPNPSVSGVFQFSPSATNTYGDEPRWSLDISYTISGLSPGAHNYHVHNLGNLWSNDGYSVEEHFIGQPAAGTRPADSPEIGLLNFDNPIPTDGDLSSQGGFSDTQARIVSGNGILGRSMIIHDTLADGTLSRSSECVVGLITQDQLIYQPDIPTVKRAIAVLNPTTVAPAPGPTGFIEFTLNQFGSLNVKVFIGGLTASTMYYILVHQQGSLAPYDGTGAGDVFVGFGLPSGSARFVGEIGGRVGFSTDANGVLSTFFTDGLAQLNGMNSILGRTIMVHAGASTGPPHGLGVIGIKEGYGSYLPTEAAFFGPPTTGTSLPVADLVVYAVARMLPAPGSPSANAKGVIEFRQTAQAQPKHPHQVRIQIWLLGLAPNTDYTMQVLTNGNLGGGATPDLTGLGSTFVGWGVLPPVNRTEVGSGWNFTSDAKGVVRVHTFDPAIMLNNYNSIVGRSVVVYDSTGTAVAYGLIGVGQTVAPYQAYAQPPVTAAFCRLDATTAGAGVSGSFAFTQATPTSPVSVTYNLVGIATGFTYHVHEAGDVFDDAGFSVRNHLIGTAPSRGAGLLCEAGAINNGAASATLTGTFTDSLINLVGVNGIVGRSMVVHAPTTGVRMAQCVIGIQTEANFTGPTAEAMFDPSPAVVTPPCTTDCTPTQDDDSSASHLFISSLLITLSALAATFLSR